jgi:hypothetical protein
MNRLMDRAAAATALGKDPLDVGMEQRVQASEAAEERDRVRELRQQQKRQGEDEKKASYFTWRRLTKLGLPAAAAGIGVKKLGDAANAISNRMLESQRELAPFSGRIATAFATLEMERRRRMLGRAEATGGSTMALADSINSLEARLEPLSRDLLIMKNFLGAKLADLTGAALKIAEMHPILRGIGAAARKWEQEQAKKAAELGIPFEEHIRALTGGDFGPPKDAKQEQADEDRGFVEGRKLGDQQAERNDREQFAASDRLLEFFREMKPVLR